MALFLDNFPRSSSAFELSSTCWPQHELTTSFEVDETLVYLSNNPNSNLHCLLDDNELSPISRKRSSSMADVYESR